MHLIIVLILLLAANSDSANINKNSNINNDNNNANNNNSNNNSTIAIKKDTHHHHHHHHRLRYNRNNIPLLSAVMLTTGKDTRVFEKSIDSALNHLLDVDQFYVITPSYDQLKAQFKNKLGPRVIFIDESTFPFRGVNVSDIMYESVKQKGIYPLNNGKSQFETMLWSRIGWFLQQILKMYAGKILNLEDFVILDSDIVWLRNVYFISENNAVRSPPSSISSISTNSSINSSTNMNTSNTTTTKYYYTTSTQYHPSYVSTSKRISGIEMFATKERFRSGVCHHMVIAKHVLASLMETSEKQHEGMPFWQVMLNQRLAKKIV